MSRRLQTLNVALCRVRGALASIKGVMFTALSRGRGTLDLEEDDQHVLGTMAPLSPSTIPTALSRVWCTLALGEGLGNSHGCLPGPPRNSVGEGSAVSVRASFAFSPTIVLERSVFVRLIISFFLSPTHRSVSHCIVLIVVADSPQSFCSLNQA